MKRFTLLAVVLLGCGGVSPDELRACRDASVKIAEAQGCAFRWSSCMEKEGNAWCAFGMDCGQGVTESTNTCLRR